VRYVVYSHLHLDHAGGMCYFPNAVHVVQRDEIRYAMWPDTWTRPVYCQNDYRDIRKLNILELDGDFDLFNDGTLRLVKTPGHAPGHQVLIVNLHNRGRICLAADTGHQRDDIVLTMTIHAAAVLIMAFVGTRIRFQLETRRLHQWSLIAILICATGLIGLVLAMLHGIECGIWAAAYLWLGAVDSSTDALLYSVDSMATLGGTGLTLQRPWQVLAVWRQSMG
jgi:hypothetical protein